MMRKLYLLVVFAMGMVLSYAMSAADANALKTKPFLYNEGFESGAEPLKPLFSRGKNTVNFQGITSEKPFSGKKSWKLDITLDKGGRCDYAIPLDNIPVGENLKFTAMIRVEKCPPRSRVVLCADFSCWPCAPEMSSARSFAWNVQYDDWTKLSADLPDLAHSLANCTHSFATSFWPPEPENTGMYVAKITLQVFSRDKDDAERRIVVYLDDIKIEGEVADKDEYRKDAEKRWAPVAEKTNRKIDSWESDYSKAVQESAALRNLSGEAAKLREELEKKLKENDVRKLGEIQEARKKGWMTAETKNRLDAFYRNVMNYYIPNIKDLALPENAAWNKGGSLVYVVNTTATSADRILPDTVLLPGRISDKMNVAACPGEYEPASFAVHALQDVKSLEIKVGDLSGSQGKIPASAVDVKVVKCWYQEESGKRVLTPELLLNDENLVQVDNEKKISRIRFNLASGGQKYLCADDPEWKTFPDRNTQTPAWVSNDSETLLPVEVPASGNKQFWVTVHVPQDAKPGDYKGKISLIADGKPAGEITLSLAVLPVTLSAPYCQTSIYRHEGADTIEKRYRSMVKDQLAHGVGILMGHLYIPNTDPYVLMDRTLKIRQELGAPADTWLAPHGIVYSQLAGGSHKNLADIKITEDKKARYLEEYRKHVKLAQAYGYKEILFYLADERDGRELEAWLPVFDLVRSNGAKVMSGNGLGRTFEIAGGRHDIYLCENGVTKREADKWHSKGEKIWPIWNPGGGTEDFDLNRRNHGLEIWKAGYDGVTEYLYGLENGWLEAASDKTGISGDGAQNMAFLTTDGVIDTIQWEGFREGIDDLRYVTTLQQMIRQAKETGRKKEAVAEAEKYIGGIDVKDGDLDQIRSGIIANILKLM